MVELVTLAILNSVELKISNMTFPSRIVCVLEV